MFWGLLLEPGKRYSTTVDKSFHVSKAALDCSSTKSDNEILSVILETEGSEALLCNLCKQKGILQESLDLNFMTGDRVTFECRGHGRIHLTGYVLPDDEDDMSGLLGEDESDEEEELASSPVSQQSSPGSKKKGKRKQDGMSEVAAKKMKPDIDEDDDDDDTDSEGDGEDSDLSDEMDDDSSDDEDIDDEESDKDDLQSDEEENNLNVSQKKKQKQQQQKQEKSPNKQNLNSSNKKTPVTNGLTLKDLKGTKKTPGSDKSSPAINTTPNTKNRLKLEMGVLIKEVKVGTGPPAKPGKTVQVHYLGKLRDGNKVFDKQLKGEPFKFKLGKGEVIKGWDIGLQGMKVGGKRIIHCPPEAAYGAKGVPPKIPSNSSLIFEVELKGVN